MTSRRDFLTTLSTAGAAAMVPRTARAEKTSPAAPSPLVNQAIPCYRLRGYSVRWIVYGYDDLAMEGGLIMLPELAPGDEHAVTFEFKTDPAKRITVETLRPTGFSVAGAAV